jgi:hypothetical protein
MEETVVLGSSDPISALEKKLCHNSAELEVQASIAMDILSKYSYDYILPVNIDKTNTLLIHSVVAPQYPLITYRSTTIKFVKKSRYEGVQITTKLGWVDCISHSIR